MAKKNKTENSENVNKTFTSGIAKINFSKRKVEIIFPYKKITYIANGSPREYANYSMIFNCATQEEAERYASVLVGLELMPTYCHADAEVAAGCYQVIAEKLAERLNGTTPRGDSEEELTEDELALLDEELKSLIG